MRKVWQSSRGPAAIGPVAGAIVLAAYGLCLAGAGFLTVLSDPTGAKVWVDERLVGQTPVQGYRLPPGSYNLRIVDPTGQIARNEAVQVASDSTSVVSVTLQNEYGAMVVESVPKGAEVYITTKLGATPLTDDQVVPGAYNLELRHPSGRYVVDRVENVVVQNGGAVTITRDLKKRKLLNKKAAVRLGLGLLAAGGAVLGGVGAVNDDPSKMLVGYIGGAACLVGLEIVALF